MKKIINLPVEITIMQEEMRGKPIYVAVCPVNGIASQGRTLIEAEENIKEALLLYMDTSEGSLTEEKSEFKPPY